MIVAEQRSPQNQLKTRQSPAIGEISPGMIANLRSNGNTSPPPPPPTRAGSARTYKRRRGPRPPLPAAHLRKGGRGGAGGRAGAAASGGGSAPAARRPACPPPPPDPAACVRTKRVSARRLLEAARDASAGAGNWHRDKYGKARQLPAVAGRTRAGPLPRGNLHGLCPGTVAARPPCPQSGEPSRKRGRRPSQRRRTRMSPRGI